jgi:protein TonB
MFEDSLVESTGRIRTRSGRYAAGSFVLETALVAVIILIPYLYPDVIPRKFIRVPLIAPPPAAAAPIPEPQRAVTPSASHTELLETTIQAPGHIPRGFTQIIDPRTSGQTVPGVVDFGGPRDGVIGVPGLGPGNAPPIPRVHPAKPTGPLHVSEGVAAGQLIVPIQPRYPAIALVTHTQGTVVVAAIISTEGRIESLRVLSGPPMLVSAAVDAIRQARYRPWKLNGEPVEVETTINVVFSLSTN